jgi:Kef-type K+ transport system membrane component KefB
MAPAQLSPLFFLQLAIIIVAARAVGWVGRRYLGQPQVVGEMLAGVILGPSLLGIVAPHWEATLFPKEGRTLLYVLSQFGVGLYMFIVGLGFRSDHFRTRAKSAVAVSLSGMAVPFGLALLLSPWLVHAPGLFGRGVAPLQATLFLGAAIAITAFPMLARIIRERGLSNSRVGTLALAAGAIDDASAWAVLAIVLATLGGDPMAAAKAIGGGLLFAMVAVMAGPRLLAPLARHAERFGVDTGLLALTIGLYALCAGAMDFIGLHAVFGGFILGAVIPRGRYADDLQRQLEPITVALLLPIFFTFSGLNTQLTLVNSLTLAGVALAILAASVLAKGGACYVAARLTGQDHTTALGVGALMNARGLMELIITNIGLQHGVITPALFSVLVLMAIITTLMTAPLFALAFPNRPAERSPLSKAFAGSTLQ